MIFHSSLRFINEDEKYGFKEKCEIVVLGAGKSSVDVISAGSNMIITILGSTIVMKVGAVFLAMKVGCVGVVLP